MTVTKENEKIGKKKKKRVGEGKGNLHNPHKEQTDKRSKRLTNQLCQEGCTCNENVSSQSLKID